MRAEQGEEVGSSQGAALLDHCSGESSDNLLDRDRACGRKREYVTLTTQLGATANLLNALIGTGLLSMPRGFADAGILLGTLSIAIIGFFSYRSATLIVQCKQLLPGGSGTLLHIAGTSLSPSIGRPLAASVLVLSQLGLAASYLTFLAQTLHTLSGLETHTSLALIFVPAVALQLIRRMEALAPISVLSSVALLFSIVAVVVHGIHLVKRHSDSGGESDWSSGSNLKGLLIAPTWPSFFGFASLSFCCHASVTAIAESVEAAPGNIDYVHAVGDGHREEAEELNEWSLLGSSPGEHVEEKQAQDLARFSKSALISFFTAGALYTGAGLSGVALYGRHVAPILTEAFGHGFWGVSIRIAMSLVCITTLPVQLYPVVEQFEWQLIGDALLQPSPSWQIVCTRNAIRTCCVLVPLLFSLLLPCFSQIVSLVGSLAIGILVFILPPVFYAAINLTRTGRTGTSIENSLTVLSVLIGSAGAITGALVTARDLMNGACD